MSKNVIANTLKPMLSPWSVAIGSILFLLAACGDTVENVNQTGVELFSSKKDLPECTGKNEGDLAVVKGESSLRVCMDGEWTAMTSEGSGVDGDFSCTTKELKDGSGLKIICNGDSIGVVLNGSDGKAGKDGKDGADGEDGEDGKDAVLPQDTLEADSERVAISLDSLTGFTQKGPFLKGSTVYLYELSDGRTLKQTNGNFTSKITSDDGRYKFSARDLVSQYAMVVVDGYYRNEVTGGTSDAPIRLTALTDMRKRSSVNVNLLTHMEFDRVYNLVTHGDSTGKKLTVKAAKRQAQKEILKQFHIELGENTDAEDMDVFGDSDADAALLAVSVLLQGDSSSSALSVLLTEISNDISGYGEWKNSATKARLADWALTIDMADSTSKLSLFGKNVTDWGLGDAPDFAKFVRNFASIENRLGVCGSKDAPEGIVKEVSNPKSEEYYAADYTDKSKTKVRFICRKEGDLFVWRAATDIEKDTMTLGHERSEGEVIHGVINTDSIYVYENKNWRHGTYLDSVVKKGCITDRWDTVVKVSDGEWYKCDSTIGKNVEESTWKGAWRPATQIEKDTAGLGHNFKDGDYVNGQENPAYTYVYENGNWRYGTYLDTALKQACMKDGVISNGKYKNDYYVCRNKTASDTIRLWVKADDVLNNTHEYESKCYERGEYSDGRLLSGRVNTDKKYVCDSYRKFREIRSDDTLYGVSCTGYNRDALIFRGSKFLKCGSSGWTQVTESQARGTMTDRRDWQVYKTTGIGSQIWLAQNLNYEAVDSYCYNDDSTNCITRGRLYTWAGAIDSVGLREEGKKCGYNANCELTYPVRGVCPEGWHLPDSTEFQQLIDYLGGMSVAGTKLKATSGWGNNPGTDDYGFTALSVGYRSRTVLEGGTPFLVQWYSSNTAFWSSSLSYNLTNASTSRQAVCVDFPNATAATPRPMYRWFGYSVRCVMDKYVAP
ncbi:MAG: hypothetical protein IKN70_04370 [Fibrobacter sp.]|nr:hypothetical protein [Fibrobacter sp.]